MATVVSRFCTAAMAMAATTAVLLVCVLPPALEARRPHRSRSSRPRRREAFVYAADNRTRSSAETPLFRFALFGDTHFWQPTDRRAAFIKTADGRPTRDGLLVGDSPAVLQVLLGQLRAFARGGGDFGVHTGDSLCGGSSFDLPKPEYEQALRRVADLEQRELGAWPVHHLPGNHDVEQGGTGLRQWRELLGNRTAYHGRVSPSGHRVSPSGRCGCVRPMALPTYLPTCLPACLPTYLTYLTYLPNLR